MQKTGSGKVSVLQYLFIVPVMGMCSCCASSFSQFSLQSLSSKRGIGIWISHILSLWNSKIWGGKRKKGWGGEGEFEVLHQHMCWNWKENFFNLKGSQKSSRHFWPTEEKTNSFYSLHFTLLISCSSERYSHMRKTTTTKKRILENQQLLCCILFWSLLNYKYGLPWNPSVWT